MQGIRQIRKNGTVDLFAHYSTDGVPWIPNPVLPTGELQLLANSEGANGRPYVFLVRFPPNETRIAHSHHADVLYIFTEGSNIVPGEGTYRAGEIRWVRAGHVYGPETTGPEGGAWWVISYGDPSVIPAE